MRNIVSPWLFPMLPLLAGCAVNLDTERYPAQPPVAADLEGVYRPTAETVKAIQVDGGYAERDISITLSADGRFSVENIPDWWQTDFGKPAGGFDSGGGTWKTVRHQDWWALELDFTDTKRFASKSSGAGLLTHANLIGERGHYDISLTLGDPDSGREMRFSRVVAN
jgi:hypothetical protein